MKCRESARLLSEQHDRALPLRKRVELRIHLFLCRLCQVYAAQLRMVTGVSRAAGISATDHCPGSLSEEKRRRIQTEMERR